MNYAPTEAVFRKVIEAAGYRLWAAETDAGDRMVYAVWKGRAKLVTGVVRVLDFESENAALLVVEEVVRLAARKDASHSQPHIAG